MVVIVAGGGRQGTAAAFKLSEWSIPYIIVEPDGGRVEELLREGYEAVRGDILSPGDDLWKKGEIILSAVPARLGESVIRMAARRGVDLVDISYTDFDPFTVEEEVRGAGVRVVFDAGFAPGLSNLLAGQLSDGPGRVERIRILAGGIPERYVPPLGYIITWSPEDLIEEYRRPARVKRGGRVVEVEPLASVERFVWAGLGEFESFCTDGLRSLLRTFPHVPDMEERTIRYPGHAEKMRFLLNTGFFSREMCARGGVTPYDVNLCVLKEALKGDVGDMALLQVEVEGGGVVRRARLVERAREGFTAMQRVTGFTAAAFTRLLLEEELDPGVYAPEMLHRLSRRVFELLSVEPELEEFSSRQRPQPYQP